MQSTADFFKHLEGLWQVERSIKMLADQTQLRATGQASFSHKQEQGLHYQENMHLTLANGTITHSRQEYYYQLINNEIAVYFSADQVPGPLFHTFVLEKETGTKNFIANAQHLCLQDCYDIHYQVFNPNHFVIVYEVHGPKKAYVSRSEFRRLKA